MAQDIGEVKQHLTRAVSEVGPAAAQVAAAIQKLQEVDQAIRRAVGGDDIVPVVVREFYAATTLAEDEATKLAAAITVMAETGQRVIDYVRGL